MELLMGFELSTFGGGDPPPPLNVQFYLTGLRLERV